jgi:hypothetical protein
MVTMMNPNLNRLLIPLSLILILLSGWSFLVDAYTTHKMVEFCHNLSMEFTYKESGSFYCTNSTNGTINIKEVKYG